MVKEPKGEHVVKAAVDKIKVKIYYIIVNKIHFMMMIYNTVRHKPIELLCDVVYI